MKKFLVGLIIFIVIVVAMLVQINLLSVVTFFGTAANIGIVLTTGIGLMCGKEVGGIIGGTYGLLGDIVFGKAIGIYLLLYMLTGYLSGKIGKGFSKENKTTMIMMVSVSSILFNLAFLLVAKMVYDYDTSFLYSTFTILKETIYNLIIAGILFKPMLLLAEIINKSKNSYYLL